MVIFGQSRLKYYYPLQRYDQKSYLPNISKRGVECAKVLSIALTKRTKSNTMGTQICLKIMAFFFSHSIVVNIVDMSV